MSNRTFTSRLVKSPWTRIATSSLLLALIAGALVGQDRGHRREGPGKRSARYREGSTIVNQLGYFASESADQIEFHVDKDKVFRVLENLALERIASELLNNSEPPRWSVTGTITEYQGTNYLLVRRAILKSKE